MIIDNKITTSNCTEPFFLPSFGLNFIVHVFWILEPMFHVLTCCVVLNFLLQLLELSVPAELSLKIILYSPVYSIFGYHQLTLVTIYSYRTESFFFSQFWIESYCSCFLDTGTDVPCAYLLCCPQFSFTITGTIRTGWVIVENNFIFTCIFDFWPFIVFVYTNLFLWPVCFPSCYNTAVNSYVCSNVVFLLFSTSPHHYSLILFFFISL
jgi:hypothetical protein